MHKFMTNTRKVVGPAVAVIVAVALLITAVDGNFLTSRLRPPVEDGSPRTLQTSLQSTCTRL
jgi:hypothetical protein